MSATINKRQLHNCGPAKPCPQCRANVYVATLVKGLCVACAQKPQPQTPLELAIERLAEKLEGL